MPSLFHVVGEIERNDAHDELGTEKTSSCRQGHPAKYINPASDPAQDGHPSLPADHSNPVVLTSSLGWLAHVVRDRKKAGTYSWVCR